MITNTDWLVHLRHHDDLVREADEWRLAQLAVSARSANKTKKKAAHKISQSKPMEVVCCNPPGIPCCPSEAG